MRTEHELYIETNYAIIYEDDFFLAVEKPAPLPVHPVGRFKERNLLSLLKKEWGSAVELRIVNRLDSETSGLVLVAKSSEAAGKLGILFQDRRVLKEYQAIVFGAPAPRQGKISIPLGMYAENSQKRRTPDPAGESALTEYEVLKEYGNYSILKIVPHTGRTHQIRAHLSFIGHPIAGDKIYIRPEIFDRYVREGWQEDMRSVVKAERLLLHAVRLEFRHPYTGENLKLNSPVPPVFLKFLDPES